MRTCMGNYGVLFGLLPHTRFGLKKRNDTGVSLLQKKRV